MHMMTKWKQAKKSKNYWIKRNKRSFFVMPNRDIDGAFIMMVQQMEGPTYFVTLDGSTNMVDAVEAASGFIKTKVEI